VVQERLVFDPEEALAAAGSLGFPVVLKGLMPGEVHKTEHGLVRLGIDSRERLQSSFEELSAKLKEKGRILLQRQATVDYELIAGFLRDDQFGPCVMFGLGGIFSELQRDVVFAAAPLTRREALKLIRKIKGRRLLEGFRGMAPLDENLMAEILVNLGNLGAGNPIEQIDINPLVVHKGVPLAVDATVIPTKT
jgi:acetate---CoA ligase (ADP-forming)